MFFSIINTGNESAINVKLKLENDFIENLKELTENKKVLKNFAEIGLSLIPNKKIYIPTFCRYINLKDEVIELSLKYNSIHGDIYDQSLLFDAQMYGAIKDLIITKISAITDNRNNLKSISDYLKKNQNNNIQLNIAEQ